jgi:hypothetical protein
LFVFITCSSEDTIQNTSYAIAGVNAISDNDPDVFHSSTQIEYITVGELTIVVSGILSDPSFINKITSIMSQQVTIIMSKTILLVFNLENEHTDNFMHIRQHKIT